MKKCNPQHAVLPTDKRLYLSARNLMNLPLEERNRLVQAALEQTQADDIELFEAFSEADFAEEYAP